MGQGAHHLGLSLAPATDNSLSAGASCASSLPAGAVVVTMRLAQRCCRSYAGRIAAENRDGSCRYDPLTLGWRVHLARRRDWRRASKARTDVSAGAVK